MNPHGCVASLLYRESNRRNSYWMKKRRRRIHHKFNERNKQKKVVVELKLKTETDDGMVLLNSVGALKLIINEWIKSYPPLLLLLIAYPIPCPSHTLARYLH
jgi:hypothetical protein